MVAFGNGIPYRQGEPIKLLEYNIETSKIEIEQEALGLINEIDQPIAVIAVGKNEEGLGSRMILYNKLAWENQ